MSYNVWRSIVRSVQNGESVDQATINRAVFALVDRTEYLKARLENLDPASGRLTYSNAVTDSGVEEGDWVYFDDVDSKFRKALAELEWNEALKALMPTKRSLVVGMVIQKLTPTTAIIFLRGTGITLTGQPGIASMADLLQDGETEFVSGRYFLSSTTPGKMTATPTCAPLVPLGFFGENSSTIDPDLREVFDAHLHHRYFLYAKPASSQTGRTGWNSMSDGGSNGLAYVDYGTDVDCVIQLSLRKNPALAPSTVRARVDLSRTNTNKLRVKIYEEPPLNDPTDVSTALLFNEIFDWPEYGEELTIGADVGLNLIIAFVRVDLADIHRHEDNVLSDDIASGDFVAIDSGWKVYVPNDLQGWTNANPVDPRTPQGAYYRYIVEGHLDLFTMFPPVPAEGMALYEGGTLKNPADYLLDYFGIWWFAGDDMGDEHSNFPWPWDYNGSTTPPSANPKDLVLTMSTNPMGPVDSIVKCLVSRSEFLQVRRLDSDTKASTGLLELLLNLNLAVGTQTPSDGGTCLGGINADGNRFLLGNKVARLIAGPNIRMVTINSRGQEVSDEGPFTGLVKVEAVLPELSGGATSFTLFNAKESERNGVIYTEFLPPETAKTKMVAKICVPNFDRGSNSIRFRLFGRFFGEESLSAEAKAGIFKVDFRIVRPGVNLASELVTPIRTEGWQVDFPANYSQFAVLANELPVFGSTGQETFKKQPATSVYDLYADNLIEPNDSIFVTIERLSNSSPFLVGDASNLAENTLDGDDYEASIGLVDLRWTITLS